jgi:DNA-3-methyladenine glycosylase II
MSGEVPLRLRAGGFEGMSAIITSQLLSVASANAIHNRLKNLLDEISAENYLELSKEDIRGCGYSEAKYKTMRIVAKAELDKILNYDELGLLPVKEAMTNLTSLKGIGVWSAEIYLLFCVGHGDIFPAGDLVLQKMLTHILELEERPNEKQVREIVASWSPYKGAASRLLWRYFAVLKNREGIKI